MVGQAEALRVLWKDTCTILIKEEHTDPITGVTDFNEVILFENQPCKLSLKELQSASEGNPPVALQTVKLFLSPELDIPAGSKIMVSHMGRELVFSRSGEPAVFQHHQEVQLEKLRGWV